MNNTPQDPPQYLLAPAERVASTVTRATYTVPEVCEILGLSRSLVYEMLRTGEIPARRIGARWLIARYRFDLWLNGTDATERRAG